MNNYLIGMMLALFVGIATLKGLITHRELNSVNKCTIKVATDNALSFSHCPDSLKSYLILNEVKIVRFQQEDNND